jgi:hypothetical protein
MEDVLEGGGRAGHCEERDVLALHHLAHIANGHHVCHLRSELRTIKASEMSA